MTTDHMELRKAAAERIAMPGNGGGVVMAYLTMVSVSQIALAELLAAYDALVAASSKPKKASGYSAEFEEVWTEYPKRGNHSKAAAFKCWNTRLKEGASMESMVEGMRRFAAVMTAEGRDNSKIMHAATFFGPDKRYEDEWIVPRGEVRRTLSDRRHEQEDQKAAASAAAKARLLGHRPPPPDDGMTFEMERP